MSYRKHDTLWGGSANVTATSHEALSPAFTFSYDPRSGTYRISNPYESASFGEGDARGGVDHYQLFERTSGTVSDRLLIYSDPDGKGWIAAPPVRLTYLNLAIWTHTDSASETTRDTYQLFGFITPPADMPRSGTAFYETYTSASMLSRYGSERNDLTGSGMIDVNFGTGTLRTELTLIALPTNLLGTFSGTAPINGNLFSGNFDSSTAVHFRAGSFNGGFFGPAAAEAGYTFLIHLTPENPYGGASLRVQDDWIVGSVIGRQMALPGP